jgi:hypothetical protein
MNESTTIIAARRYYIEPPDGDLELVVSFERPVREPSGYYGCTYRFGGDHEETRHAGGGDEIHALVIALEMAGSYLDRLNERKYGGKLQWDGGSATGSLPTVCDHWPYLKQSGE